MAYWDGTRWLPEETGSPPAVPARRRTRRLLGATAEAGLITLLVFGLIAGTALAGKGGNGGGGKPGGKTSTTVTVVVLDGADAVPNHTERVTFDVTTTATDRPFIQLMCWQGSTGVYNNSTGDFDTYMFDPWLTLDSSYWTAGIEASCTARVYHYNRRGQQIDLTSMDFGVAP